jgi:hypothetical protein
VKEILENKRKHEKFMSKTGRMYAGERGGGVKAKRTREEYICALL